MNKAVDRSCNQCAHWSEELCLDKDNKPIPRQTLEGMKFWTYELCKKNWGLPKSAHYNASHCQLFKEVKAAK